jgi:hypothetical protein
MSTVTRSFLHLSSYMVIPFFPISMIVSTSMVYHLTVSLLSASIFSVASVGSTWLLSSPVIKPTFNGGNFLLSLPELSRI